MRVLPYWPMDRFLELAPKSWSATRARPNPIELEAALCPFTIPLAVTARGVARVDPG